MEKPVINFTMVVVDSPPFNWVALDCECGFSAAAGTMEFAKIFRLEHLLDHIFRAIDRPRDASDTY